MRTKNRFSLFSETARCRPFTPLPPGAHSTSMKATAAPTRDEVRSHTVNRVSQEPENSIKHSKYTPEQGKQTLQGNEHDRSEGSPTLVLKRDGTALFKYSVDRDTSYVCKKPSLQPRSVRQDDPVLFGYTLSEWEQLLSAHPPLAEGVGQSVASERKEILESMVKERFILDLRSSGVHADYLNVSGCSKYMSAWEQCAICSLLTILVSLTSMF